MNHSKSPDCSVKNIKGCHHHHHHRNRGSTPGRGKTNSPSQKVKTTLSPTHPSIRWVSAGKSAGT